MYHTTCHPGGAFDVRRGICVSAESVVVDEDIYPLIGSVRGDEKRDVWVTAAFSPLCLWF